MISEKCPFCRQKKRIFEVLKDFCEWQMIHKTVAFCNWYWVEKGINKKCLIKICPCINKIKR